MYQKGGSFFQDRLGTNVGKTQTKDAFSAGFIARLGELDEVLTDLSTEDISDAALLGEYKTSSKGDAVSEIRFDDVDIVTPTGSCLAKSVSVAVTPSTPLMVTGANAVGKTSFFRVLGGLWPVHGGSLTVPAAPGESTPGIGEIFLVPQRIYMCIGTLADQLTYPKRFPKEVRKTPFTCHFNTQTISFPRQARDKHRRSSVTKKGVFSQERTVEQEAEMMELLELVGIGYLVERWQKDMAEGESGWDYETKWEDVLSLGEQQRTGMARLFYHKPKFGVLDECAPPRHSLHTRNLLR